VADRRIRTSVKGGKECTVNRSYKCLAGSSHGSETGTLSKRCLECRGRTNDTGIHSQHCSRS